ncbi:hypothetical protein CGRA01v4_02416 [Colletotrichum graminicola]|nr:hypothetical protein CGRA01v4_02416 [Colletotrichum graminicola]
MILVIPNYARGFLPEISSESGLVLHVTTYLSIRPGPPAARITLARCMHTRWETQRVLQPACSFSYAMSIHLARVDLSLKSLYLAYNHASYRIYHKVSQASP